MTQSVIDAENAEAYTEFRAEAAANKMRHFLEVFAPNPVAGAPADPGRFLNDFVARTLAGVVSAARPLFLKMPYPGPRAMRALAAYDPHLIPGVLGGASGTTPVSKTIDEWTDMMGFAAHVLGLQLN